MNCRHVWEAHLNGPPTSLVRAKEPYTEPATTATRVMAPMMVFVRRPTLIHFSSRARIIPMNAAVTTATVRVRAPTAPPTASGPSSQ